MPEDPGVPGANASARVIGVIPAASRPDALAAKRARLASNTSFRCAAALDALAVDAEGAAWPRASPATSSFPRTAATISSAARATQPPYVTTIPSALAGSWDMVETSLSRSLVSMAFTLFPFTIESWRGMKVELPCRRSP